MKMIKQSLNYALFCFLLGATSLPGADLNPVILGSAPGETVDMVVQRGFAYVASSRAGLRIIDVHNPSSLHQIALVDLKGNATSVVLTNDVAYLANYYGGQAVVDVRDPFLPRLLAAFPPEPERDRDQANLNGARQDRKIYPDLPCLARPRYQLVTDVSAGMTIFDVRRPSRPFRVGGFFYEADGHSLEASSLVRNGNLVNVGDSEQLTVIDISRWANPQRRGNVRDEESFGGVSASGNYAHVGTWRRVPLEFLFNAYDMRLPVRPRKVAAVPVADLILDIKAAGHHAYLASYAGLQVVNISNPTNPIVFAPVAGIPYGESVAVAGNLVCVASLDYGLHLVDVQNPAQAQLVGIYHTNGAVNDVALQGHYAYAANDTEGLEVVDVSNPASPQRVGQYRTGAYAVAVAGDYAYVGGRNSLKVINISDPAQPLPTGAASTRATVRSIVVLGRHAYTALRYGGVAVYDISDPENPREVGGNTAFTAYSLAAHRGRILATGDTDTLTVLRPYRPVTTP